MKRLFGLLKYLIVAICGMLICFILVPAVKSSAEEETPEIKTFSKNRLDYEVIQEYSPETGYGAVRITGNSYKGTITGKAISFYVTNGSEYYYVREIGDQAFLGTKLEYVELPYTVTKIGACAFYGSSSLKSISLGKNVQYIGAGAFAECPSLTEVYVPTENPYINVKKNIIYDEAYTCVLSGNGASGSVKLPDTVVEIAAYAFEGNANITSVNCDTNLRKIGADAFYNCCSLNSIAIKSKTDDIDGNPFKYCNSLTDITVSLKNMEYLSKNGMLLTKSGKTLIAYPAAEGDIIIADGIYYISEFAFCGAKELTSIRIPATVKKIRNGAFYDCRGLKKIFFESRKTKLVKEENVPDMPIFGNTDHYLNISLPYSSEAGNEGSIEAALESNTPKGSIFINR